jgi:imidazole glycerol-phosphate synthase subunit HisH
MGNGKIVIVDYGMGNLYSVHYKVRKVHPEVTVSSSPEEIREASKIILPGVGHFAAGMKCIRERKLLDVLNYKAKEEKVPVLGICLGMQLMSEFSEEGNAEGLGWFNARTIRFDKEELNGLKIPHMGWNTVRPENDKQNIFKGIEPLDMFYFVHSYHVVCSNNEDILCSTEYGINFISGISKGNIYGFQFHPEKSHDCGSALLKNFISI